jgi:hypothetical protein
MFCDLNGLKFVIKCPDLADTADLEMIGQRLARADEEHVPGQARAPLGTQPTHPVHYQP